MSNLPDFTPFGYQVTEILNNNVQGERITYKAVETTTQTPVVIKQFKFVTQSNGDEYKAIEQEIDVLKELNHPGIPNYLAQFDPNDGLCLVQEYINAQPLSNPRNFSPEEIKSIAVQTLKILVYLQKKVPIVIHKNIKPENILIEDIPSQSSLENGEGIKVYLVDFGLARIDHDMMGGTLGFMPPEQVHNQKLTEASDLYGLGTTLICLITETKSADIASLVDFSTNKVTFKDKVSKYGLKFIKWLEKMVEPNPVKRFQTAEIGLEGLKLLNIMRVPEVKLDQLKLNFVAENVGEILSKTITISNTIPDTILRGELSVLPHPSDPPHTPDHHAWIRFSPREFEGNKVKCTVTVDTSKLKAGENYRREIVLDYNGQQDKYYTSVNVETVTIQLGKRLPPYGLIIFSGLSLVLLSGILSQAWIIVLGIKGVMSGTIVGAIIGAIVGAMIGAIVGAIMRAIPLAISLAISCAIVGAISLAVSLAISWVIVGAISLAISWVIVGTIFVAIVGGISLAISRTIVDPIRQKVDHILENQFYRRGYKSRGVIAYLILTTATSILTGVGAVMGLNPYLLVGLIASALSLTGMLIYPPIKQRQLNAQYRRQDQQNLIEP